MAFGQFFKIIVGIGLSLLAQRQARKLAKQKPTPFDNTPTTHTTRGSWTPYILGRAIVGSLVGWAGNRELRKERDREAEGGGKGGGKKQKAYKYIYYEDSWHLLCTGIADKLHRIRKDGKDLWTGPISRQSHPSGSSISVAEVGSFTIYWGEKDQPINTKLSEEMGIASRFPSACYVVWDKFQLGRSAFWPSLEYDVETLPSENIQTLTGLVEFEQFTTPSYLMSDAGVLEADFSVISKTESYNGGSSTYSDFYTRYTSDSTISGYEYPGVTIGHNTILTYGNHESNFPAGQDILMTGLTHSEAKLNKVEGATYVTGKSLVSYPADFTNITLGSTTYLPAGGFRTDGVSATVSEDKQQLQISKIDTHFRLYADWPEKTETQLVPHNMTIVEETFFVRFRDLVDADNSVCRIRIDLPTGASLNLGFTTAEDVTNNRLIITDVVNIKSFGGFGYLEGMFNDRTNPIYLKSWKASGDKGGAELTIRYLLVNPEWNAKKPIPDNVQGSVTYQLYNLRTNFSFLSVPQRTLLDYTEVQCAEPVAVTTYSPEYVTHPSEEAPARTDIVGEGDVRAIELKEYYGWHPACMILQLLTEPYPHGISTDQSLLDIPQIVKEGNKLKAEGMAVHALVTDGKDAQTVLQDLLEDLGAMITFNHLTGKYELRQIRQYTEEDAHVLSAHVMTSNEPEIESLLDYSNQGKVAFSFPDIEKQFKTSTIVVDNDGESTTHYRANTVSAEIASARDRFTAGKIAERRSIEELGSNVSWDIKVNRHTHTVRAGDVLKHPDYGYFLRVMAVDTPVFDQEVTLACVADSYGQVESFPSIGSEYEYDTVFVEADLMSRLFEIPAYIARDNTVPYSTLLRVRSSNVVTGAEVYLSRDATTYHVVATDSDVTCGGTLVEDISNDPWDAEIETGALVDLVGSDTSDVLDLTSSEDSWRTGQQMVVVGNEIMFCQGIEIVSTTQFRLKGLLRGRYGTTVASHAVGEEVYITQREDVDQFEDALIKDGAKVYYKPLPFSPDGFMDIEDIRRKEHDVRGDSMRPSAPTNLNTPEGSRAFETDMVLSWNYRAVTGQRTGAGYQVAGVPTGTSPVEGSFTAKIFTEADVLKETVPLLTTPNLTLTDAELTSIFGSALSAGDKVKITITHAGINGIASDPVTETFTKV